MAAVLKGHVYLEIWSLALVFRWQTWQILLMDIDITHSWMYKHSYI